MWVKVWKLLVWTSVLQLLGNTSLYSGDSVIVFLFCFVLRFFSVDFSVARVKNHHTIDVVGFFFLPESACWSKGRFINSVSIEYVRSIAFRWWLLSLVDWAPAFPKMSFSRNATQVEFSGTDLRDEPMVHSLGIYVWGWLLLSVMCSV